MANRRDDNTQYLTVGFPVEDIAKIEILIKGKKCRVRRFGRDCELSMKATDYIRNLVHASMAPMKMSAAAKALVRQMVEDNSRRNGKKHKSMAEATDTERDRLREHGLTRCVICTEPVPDEICFDESRHAIDMGSGTADKTVIIKVGGEGARLPRQALVPMTAEWRDRLLTFKHGKIVGNAMNAVVIPPSGRAVRYLVRAVKVAGRSYVVSRLQKDGRVLPAGIVPAYFAVCFIGRGIIEGK